MNKDLDNRLREKYPNIFKDSERPLWGFECDDGWFDIIDVLCSVIQSHINHNKEQINWAQEFNKDLEIAKNNNWEGWNDAWLKTPQDIPKEIDQVVAMQVKEKFAQLRFYYSGGDDYIDGAVTMAESISLRTCEVCGEKGKVVGDYWIKTRCKEHEPKS